MKILLAEDDIMMREMLEAFLAGLGHAVRATTNGSELVALALTDKPDLIVTDMHMPEMRGDSMIAMLDIYPPLADIPVILITGATRQELSEAAIPDEIPIFSKPVDFEKLTATVKKFSDRSGGIA